jgi:hypothetical protein
VSWLTIKPFPGERAYGIERATREILRTGVMDTAWGCLCSAQEWLERTHGEGGITPPYFFAYWRAQLEAAWFGGDAWAGILQKPAPKIAEVTAGA